MIYQVSSIEDVKDKIPPPKFEAIQNSFSGGMNLMSDDTKLGDDEYREAFNIINRYDRLEVINEPEEFGFEAIGRKQGWYPVGKYIFAFAGGKAYYKLVTDLRFTQVPHFQMSPTVDRIYVCPVPISTANLKRQLLQQVDFQGNNINPSLDTIVVNQGINTSPQCLVCQDGVNQPWIIYLDPTSNKLVARVIQKYTEWGLETSGNIREYVPIGCDMLYTSDGILIVLSPDRTKLYRSVNGRPLDFVVNVSIDGSKGGDADTTFYSVGAKIIAMFMASGYTEGFCISTETNITFGIISDWNNTIFGEPTFDKQFLFATAALNSFSVVDINGDTAFIDSEGVKSFNGARQQSIESGNTIFSLKVSSLFKDVQQDLVNASAIIYNSYALFGVNTIYGSVILLYDTLTQKWVSILRSDKITGFIKQFVSLKPYAKNLYCMTSDDKMFEIFPNNINSLPAAGEVNTQAFVTNTLKVEQKLEDARAIIRQQKTDGEITINLFIDDAISSTDTKPIRSREKLHNIVAPYSSRTFIGWKVNYNVKWTGGGFMTHFMHTSELQFAQQSFDQSKGIFQK